ncbi:uncharacterized protein LOC122263482 [Penaeus japonicus]|uniref:uncharacterized protein LOC122262293 n=1 Tax=Penaeus japonicus TaxID=27405 RepID=UPI001C716DB2|nr:uncharacterized protein LOC122262293 [Penaeus japonicus]XP_042887848.1 uncharacterized protein LOC122263482 [Penaeus japonicus]
MCPAHPFAYRAPHRTHHLFRFFSTTWTFDAGFFDSIASRKATVLDTDYTNFSVLVECQRFWPFRRVSAVILSRTNTLDDATIAKIKEDLNTLGYDIDDFDKINHETCNPDADFNLGVDEQGNFNFNGEPLPVPAIPEGLPAEVIPELNEVLGARRRRR